MWIKRMLFRVLVLSISVGLCSSVFDGVHVTSPLAALSAGIMLTLLHLTVRPILLLLSLPLLVLTFGLFLWVVNAGVLLLASGLVPGFHIASFGSALVASLLISLVQWICDRWWWRSVGAAAAWTFSVKRGGGGARSARPPRGPLSSEKTIDLEERPGGRWE